MGTLDDVVVAFAVSTVGEDGRGVRRGRLDACFVEEGARGVGVGRLLLDRSLAWMAEQGCAGVDGTALPGDRGAKSFYESAGFKARLLTMHRPLDGTVTGRWGREARPAGQEARRPGEERAGTGRRGPGGGGMGMPMSRASSGT